MSTAARVCLCKFKHHQTSHRPNTDQFLRSVVHLHPTTNTPVCLCKHGLHRQTGVKICACKARFNARDTRRVAAAEMKYVKTAGYTWTTKQPHKLQKALKITQILDKIQEYKRSWTQHVNRMPRNRLPRVLKHYSSIGIKESWQTF